VLLGVTGCGTETTGPNLSTGNPFLPARVGTDSTLEIMTWNIREFARDGQRTAEYVRLALEALAVDVVAIQEIDGDNLGPRYFDAVVAGLEGWGGFRATSDRYLNLGFFYRTDGDLDVESFTEILDDEYALPRAPLVMQARYRGETVVVINNHFKCCDGGGDRERRAAASLLLEEYVRANLDSVPVVIVGDLNDSLTDPAATNVFANFLADPAHWRFVDLPIAEDPGALWSYPSWPSHIDHILVTDEFFAAADDGATLVQVVPLSGYLPGTTYANVVSDHLPVVLRFAP